MIRIEVTDRVGNVLARHVPSLDELDPHLVAAIEPHIDELRQSLADVCGGIHRVDDILTVVLMRHLADIEAYERVAARKGLLAL